MCLAGISGTSYYIVGNASEPLACKNCSANAYCIKIRGVYSCKCKLGFEGNGVECVKYDWCSRQGHLCYSRDYCKNEENGSICSCPEGYVGNGRSCRLPNAGNCTLPCGQGRCFFETTNSVVRRLCYCDSGYTFSASSQTCEDNDECSLGTAECSPNADCINTNGSYRCVCKSGRFRRFFLLRLPPV